MIKKVQAFIKESTSGMTNEQYCYFLDQLQMWCQDQVTEIEFRAEIEQSETDI